MKSTKARHWDISEAAAKEISPRVQVSEFLPELGADPYAALSSALKVAHPFIMAPVAWMHAEFPEAVPEAHLDPYTGFEEEGSLFEALGVLGRNIGELGVGGYSPEAPWQEYDIKPEHLEEFLPIATELALYPTAAKYLTETLGAMVKGARMFQEAVYPFSSPLRATGTIAEGMAGGIRRTEELEGMWRSMLQEDEMAMNLGIAGTHRTPRHPGAEPTSTARVRQYTSQIWEELGRKDTIPTAARETIRDQMRIGMDRLRGLYLEEGYANALKEIEASGVDIEGILLRADPFNEKLYVTPDKFNRLADRVNEVVRAELPPKLVTEIHERIIPEIIGDERYTRTAQAAKRRQSMARALNEGLGPDERITADQILQANKDPNMREKLANLMVRRIHRSPWYKTRDQGFANLSLLMRLGEIGFGAVTGAAIDEENRLRGAIAGAAVAVLLGSALRLSRRLGEAGAAEVGPPWAKAARDKILGRVEREGPRRYAMEPPVSYETLQAKPNLAAYVLKRQAIHDAKTIKLAEQIKTEGKIPMTQKLGFTKEESAARKTRARVMGKSFGIAKNLGMDNMEYRAWIVDRFGKSMRQMSEGEIVDKIMPALTQLRAERVVGAEELAIAQKARQIEDRAMELYGAKAKQRIDRAIKRTVGVHRDLRELDTDTMESVLEVLPKRFLVGRGMKAVGRNIMAIEDGLNMMGPWGKHIVRKIHEDRLHTEYLAGRWTAELLDLTKGLNEEQMTSVVAALHPMKANGYKVVPPPNEHLAEVATKIRTTLNEIGGLRKDIGDPVRLANGSEMPFELMENYYPIHVAPEEWLNSIMIRRRVIDHLIETGQAAGETTGNQIFNQFIQGIVRNKFGNLDFAREAWIEPERFNLVKDLSRYYYGAAKRISRHMFFGRTGKSELPENIEKWLDLLRKDVGVDEFQYARKGAKRYFKHDAIDDAMHDMLKRVRSFETVAHMGLASIMNSSEPVHTAIWAGFGNFMKGVGSALKSTSAMDAREKVVRTSAAIGSTIRDLIGESGGAGSMTAKFLRITGFSPVEKWNRRLAGHVGIHYVKDITSKLVKNPQSKRLRKSFDELYLDADAILERGLTEEELIKGAMEVSNRTQKRTQAIDLPMFMSNPYGRILTMFKTFSYGAARMMVRDVATNPARLARLLVAFPIVGEVVGDVRSLATGQWRDTEGFSRLAENFMYVGTMGIAFDFLRSVQFGESSIKSFLMGPVGSDFASITDGLYSWLAEGKGRKIGKQAVRMLPPPATLLRGHLFPKVAKKKTWKIG